MVLLLTSLLLSRECAGTPPVQPLFQVSVEGTSAALPPYPQPCPNLLALLHPLSLPSLLHHCPYRMFSFPFLIQCLKASNCTIWKHLSFCFFFHFFFSLCWGFIRIWCVLKIRPISITQIKHIWGNQLHDSRYPSPGFPGGAVVENLPANTGHTGSSPGLGRSHMPWSN